MKSMADLNVEGFLFQVVLLFSLIVVFGVAMFGASFLLDNSVPDTNTTDNQSDVNVSKYYDNESQVCWSPEINQSNASELKACVSNQTSVS